MVPERKPRQSCEGHVPLQPALTGPLRSHKMGFLDRCIAPTQECLMAWRAHQLLAVSCMERPRPCTYRSQQPCDQEI